MPSGFWTGVAGGAQSQLEKILEERRKQQAKEREPSFQLQRGLVGALNTQLSPLEQAQRQQASTQLEQTAQPGSRFDMQAALSQTPSGQRFDQAGQFIEQLKNLGLGGLSSEGMTFSKGVGNLGAEVPLILFDPATGKFSASGNTPKGSVVRNLQPDIQVPLLQFDPSTGTYTEAGTTKRGTIVRNKQTPIESEVARQEALSGARMKGKGLGVAESGQLQNFQSALSAIGEIEKNLKGPQGRIPNLVQTALPFAIGQRTLKFNLTNVSDILLRMRSGAQINEREYTRLRQLLPTASDVLFGEPGVVQAKLDRFKSDFSAVLERQKQRGFSPITEENVTWAVASEAPDPFRKQLEAQGLIVEEEIPD